MMTGYLQVTTPARLARQPASPASPGTLCKRTIGGKRDELWGARIVPWPMRWAGVDEWRCWCTLCCVESLREMHMFRMRKRERVEQIIDSLQAMCRAETGLACGEGLLKDMNVLRVWVCCGAPRILRAKWALVLVSRCRSRSCPGGEYRRTCSVELEGVSWLKASRFDFVLGTKRTERTAMHRAGRSMVVRCSVKSSPQQ
ncbi:hypothetical protein DE146DRAFT_424948 [Phaeosphaeria sp. MPI-PUGE-AT-0046c]|nr:hypothetical protein DE146DRAFT_424948 [Phaeosphaeria sp. MPI-PUGE-AT-0046c]